MLGRIVRPRVYIEGVEVPCYRATVQASSGSPSTALIDIPPSEEFFERFAKNASGALEKKTGVLPRSTVHVFYDPKDPPHHHATRDGRRPDLMSDPGSKLPAVAGIFLLAAGSGMMMSVFRWKAMLPLLVP